MKIKYICFASILFTSFVVAPGLAHILALPNKIEMTRDEYLISQQVYRGWSLTAVAVLGAIISVLIQAIITRKERGIFFPTTVAMVCLLLSQLISWIYTYPANRQTNNWSYLPDNWMQLRKDWEYSHATAFIFDLIALVLIIFAVVNKKTAA